MVEIYKIYKESQVSFIHRTAREYLETSSGKRLLEGKILPERDMISRRFNTLLILLMLVPMTAEVSIIEKKKLRFVCFSELDAKSAIDMMQQLERVCDKLHS